MCCLLKFTRRPIFGGNVLLFEDVLLLFFFFKPVIPFFFNVLLSTLIILHLNLLVIAMKQFDLIGKLLVGPPQPLSYKNLKNSNLGPPRNYLKCDILQGG